ncbi:MAG: endonuclease domain-containing protein [Anaerolineae bacterium]|nr:endonuclease domain-containing protein [Anaerolineae bacterium]
MPDSQTPWEAPYLCLPPLWEKLKPLARQKRHIPTPAEEMLWKRVRSRQVKGLKFRRQHAIERFIVDFYCAEARLVIEVDGPIHDYTPDEDAVRQQYLESLELRVIRFTNDDVLNNTETVLRELLDLLDC